MRSVILFFLTAVLFSPVALSGIAEYTTINICNKTSDTIYIAVSDSQMLDHGTLYSAFGQASAPYRKKISTGDCLTGNISYIAGFYTDYTFTFTVYDSSKKSIGTIKAMLFYQPLLGGCRQRADAGENTYTGSVYASYNYSVLDAHCDYYHTLTVNVMLLGS